MKVGDVYRWDFQADVFRGEYRLVEDLGKGSWVIEDVEPSDTLIDEIMKYHLESPEGSICLDWVDPFGPGRRRATAQETMDMEIMRRIERTGYRRTVKFISSHSYAEYF